MNTAILDIKCEGDIELFTRQAISWIKEKKEGTYTLVVPNDWWMSLCLNIFIDECKIQGIPETEDPFVDVVFELKDTRTFRGTGQLSDEEIQDLIDEFIDTLDDLGTFNDADDDEEDNKDDDNA